MKERKNEEMVEGGGDDMRERKRGGRDGGKEKRGRGVGDMREKERR